MKSKIGGLVLLLLATTVSATDATASTIIPTPVKTETRSVNYRPDTNETIAKTSVHPAARVTTDYIDAKICLNYPGFEGLSVDSLGKERFPLVPMGAPSETWRPVQATRRGDWVEYRGQGADPSEPPCWAIEIKTKEILFESHWSADDPPEPLLLDADTSVSHVTLLGLMATNGSIRLPAIMHFPDQGSFRISANLDRAGSLDYSATRKNVKITFPAATREHPALTYHLKVVAIHPKIPGIAADTRFDGFRRNWLNIFQVNPQRRMLANNAGSDTCGFCFYEYGDIAEQTPPLAKGLTALDMVRQTLDRIISGAKACGMPGYTRGYRPRGPSRMFGGHISVVFDRCGGLCPGQQGRGLAGNQL